MENEKGNSKGLVILLIVFILMVLGLGGWIVYDKFFANEPTPQPTIETPQEENKEEEKYDEYVTSEYGILSYGEVKPFNDLDFSKKEYGEYVKLGENVIKYKNEDVEQNVDIPVENVVQAGTNCHCGGCAYIYYLKDNGELYSIELDHGELLEEYESKLIDSDVSAFLLFESGVVESTTCGGQDLIIKYNDGTAKINGYDLSLLERYWIFDAGYEHDLFIVSKNAKAKNYLTNEAGEKLVAKQVFITLVDNETEETKYSIYVIDENDYLYYANDYTNIKLNKFNESKVQSYKVNDEKVTITYDDDSTEVIETSLVYDYNKEFIAK